MKLITSLLFGLGTAMTLVTANAAQHTTLMPMVRRDAVIAHKPDVTEYAGHTGPNEHFTNDRATEAFVDGATSARIARRDEEDSNSEDSSNDSNSEDSANDSNASNSGDDIDSADFGFNNYALVCYEDRQYSSKCSRLGYFCNSSGKIQKKGKEYDWDCDHGCWCVNLAPKPANCLMGLSGMAYCSRGEEAGRQEGGGAGSIIAEVEARDADGLSGQT